MAVDGTESEASNECSQRFHNHVYILNVFSLALCFYIVLNTKALVAVLIQGKALIISTGLLRVKSL